MDYDKIIKSIRNKYKTGTKEQYTQIVEDYFKEYEKNAEKEINDFKEAYKDIIINKNLIDGTYVKNDFNKYKDAIKVCNNLDKNFKSDKDIYERSKKIIKDSMISELNKDANILDFKLKRPTVAIIRSFNDKDAEFLISSMNSDPNALDTERGKTVGEARQELIENQVRDFIQMLKEGAKQMNDKERVDFVEKWGADRIRSLNELEKNNLNEILKEMKVELPEDILNEFDQVKLNTVNIGTKFNKIKETADPTYQYMDPYSLRIKHSMLNEQLGEYFSADYEVDSPEAKQQKELNDLINYNLNNKQVVAEQVFTVAGNDAVDFTGLSGDTKYNTCETAFKTNLKTMLNELGCKQDSYVGDDVKNVIFKDKENKEIDYEKAFVKAMDGELIKVLNVKDKSYLTSIQTSFKERGEIKSNSKVPEINLGEKIRKKVEKGEFNESGITNEIMDELIQEETRNQLSALKDVLESHNPGYIRNQIGKSKGPYSTAIKNIEAYLKTPKMNKEEMKEKLNQIKSNAQDYMNSKINKGKFNKIETERYNAMDEVLKLMIKTDVEFENADIAKNCANEKIFFVPKREQLPKEEIEKLQNKDKQLVQEKTQEKQNVAEKENNVEMNNSMSK